MSAEEADLRVLAADSSDMDRLIDDSFLGSLGVAPAAEPVDLPPLPPMDEHVAATQDEFIAETLAWCAEMFGTTRVRFIRPLETGGWRVYTRQRDAVITHPADYAEVAMAYTVGLGKQPLLVTRPRISRIDGSGLRPIALTSYLGIPIVVQDRLIGVIEFAGEVRSDTETALYMALPRLINAGARMLYDPKLTQRPEIALETVLSLDAAIWTTGDIALSPDDLRFLAQINGSRAVVDVADASGVSHERAVELASELALRGLVSVRTAP